MTYNIGEIKWICNKKLWNENFAPQQTQNETSTEYFSTKMEKIESRHELGTAYQDCMIIPREKSL